MVLFQDESGYCRHPKLGRMWAKRGQRPVVCTRSQRSGTLPGKVELAADFHAPLEDFRTCSE